MTFRHLLSCSALGLMATVACDPEGPVAPTSSSQTLPPPLPAPLALSPSYRPPSVTVTSSPDVANFRLLFERALGRAGFRVLGAADPSGQDAFSISLIGTGSSSINIGGTTTSGQDATVLATLSRDGRLLQELHGADRFRLVRLEGESFDAFNARVASATAQGLDAMAADLANQTVVAVSSQVGPSAVAAVAPATTGAGLAALVAATPQPGSYAFIVGIEHYRDVPAAPGARADAEQFARVVRQTLGLAEGHMRVATEARATRTDVLSGLKWLKDSVGAGGRAYFFFSGHGSPSTDASTYLVPYDGNAADVAATAIAMSDAMATLGASRAKEVLMVVDACFSGAGGRSILPPGARPLMRVHAPSVAPRMALFTASQGDEISGLSPGEGGGVFTKYVTMGLGTGEADANGDGQITLQELADWVGPRVTRASTQESRAQHPTLVVGAGARDFVVEYGLATK